MRRMQTSVSLAVAMLFAIGNSVYAEAPEEATPFRYPQGKHGAGELRYINDLPVLTVSGTPEQVGEQVGMLAARPAARLFEAPREILKAHNTEALWPALMAAGQAMVARFPNANQREMRALAGAGGVDYGLLAMINSLDDIGRIFGCSSLTIDAERSATGGPLVGRNVDFYTMGYEQYSLVTVYRGEGKLAFASIGFPGMVGVMSGINEAGLTLVILDVSQSADGAPAFNLLGTPMSLTFRRVMEECRTVAEAELLLREEPRTTLLNVSLCDPQDAAVVELTPLSVEVRRGEEGRLACTNHFRTSRLKVGLACPRYEALSEPRDAKYDVAAVWERMHAADQGEATFQTMVFEPAALRLHLAFGELPSSGQEPKVLELAELFRPAGAP